MTAVRKDGAMATTEFNDSLVDAKTLNDCLPRTGRAQYYPSPWPYYHGLFHYLYPQPQPVQTAVSDIVFILRRDAFCQCARQRYKLYMFLIRPRRHFPARISRYYWSKRMPGCGSVMTKRFAAN